MPRGLNWNLNAGLAGYIDLGKQQEIYEALTGDRPDFFGFAGRFAAWADSHPRSSLKATEGMR